MRSCNLADRPTQIDLDDMVTVTWGHASHAACPCPNPSRCYVRYLLENLHAWTAFSDNLVLPGWLGPASSCLVCCCQ